MTAGDDSRTGVPTAAEVPRMVDVPIGLPVTGTRRESDSMGAIEVPADRYWGAQTQRALLHFSIGDDRMPVAVHRAYGCVKKAAAIVNGREGRLPRWKAGVIARVCDEVIAGELDEHFPLSVWQSGSGTQSNMNVNEVIANRAIQLVGGEPGRKTPIHPNDDVNMSQSSNDTFPTAMHIAALRAIRGRLLPSVEELRRSVEDRARRWSDVVKIGRTHLQDAVPLTVGQEWSGYAHQLAAACDVLRTSSEGLHELAAGGTAVGTGLNAPAGFAESVAGEIGSLTGYAVRAATNRFAAQGCSDAMVAASAGVRGVAVALMKMSNDIRWLASGPRAGLGELILPANEPGSSIMPGKLNPTQCEAMVMVCTEVVAEDGAVASAGAQGNFELNAMRPLIIRNVLHTTSILADACTNLRVHCIEGIELNLEQIRAHLDRSLMMVTALAPMIGYDRAASIARRAGDEGITLREAAVQSGCISAEEFDRVVDPSKMVG